MVVVLVRLAVFHGEQCLGQQELLHLAPCGIGLVASLEMDAACGLIGRDFIEPLDGLACVGVDALVAILEAMELSECLSSC